MRWFLWVIGGVTATWHNGDLASLSIDDTSGAQVIYASYPTLEITGSLEACLDTPDLLFEPSPTFEVTEFSSTRVSVRTNSSWPTGILALAQITCLTVGGWEYKNIDKGIATVYSDPAVRESTATIDPGTPKLKIYGTGLSGATLTLSSGDYKTFTSSATMVTLKNEGSFSKGDLRVLQIATTFGSIATDVVVAVVEEEESSKKKSDDWILSLLFVILLLLLLALLIPILKATCRPKKRAPLRATYIPPSLVEEPAVADDDDDDISGVMLVDRSPCAASEDEHAPLTI